MCVAQRESDSLKQRHLPPSFFYTHAHVTHPSTPTACLSFPPLSIPLHPSQSRARGRSFFPSRQQHHFDTHALLSLSLPPSHSLSLSLSLSLFLSRSLSLSPSLSFALSHSLSRSLSLSLSLSRSLSLSLSHALSLAISLALSFVLTVYLLHFLSLALSLALSPALSLALSLSCNVYLSHLPSIYRAFVCRALTHAIFAAPIVP